ncbi:ornithine cyclodeaminase family protein [Roseiarcaceae bacterium H3SJ34-1]|uniref:ornithine cyclodeaminase family protein n=1 Tax=Terripilifer ovatus TaxID=3032367 RepID=UPI003AB988EF|nr:ornithine cyclodeaminase family protein [Roseiarcaceae bacterium H3SJ34-1]
MTLILSNADVASVLNMADCIAVLDEAYAELGHGRGITRTRSDTITETNRGDALYSLKSMDGVAPALGVGAVRINSDIVTWPKVGNNMRRVKVPAAPNARFTGLVLLFSSETGEPLAIMPDGVMQRMRVGAANGLGIKYLARNNARSIGILGSGWQAGAQLLAACAVRQIDTIRCYSPSAENREKFSAEMTQMLGVDVIPVAQPEEAIAGADIVMCASNTVDPIFFEKWIRPGMHLSSIKRPEVEPAAILRCERVFVHTHDGKPMHTLSKGLTLPEDEGNKGWKNASQIDFAKLPSLPQLIIGEAQGRQSDDEATCFLNNLGLGYQFAAVGALIYQKARDQGLGHDLPTDWFTEDVHP